MLRYLFPKWKLISLWKKSTYVNFTVNNEFVCLIWCVSTAPHSPRKQKLNLRMKSLSLDSPESTEHVQRRRHATQSTSIDPHSSHSSSSRIQCNIYQQSVRCHTPKLPSYIPTSNSVMVFSSADWTTQARWQYLTCIRKITGTKTSKISA